jgi:hypothetical protein
MHETYEKIAKKAHDLHFGPVARGILFCAQYGPVNPWTYFGRDIRRSWAYGYFSRLAAHGLLEECSAPEGRRGHRWYCLPGQLTRG